MAKGNTGDTTPRLPEIPQTERTVQVQRLLQIIAEQQQYIDRLQKEIEEINRHKESKVGPSKTTAKAGKGATPARPQNRQKSFILGLGIIGLVGLGLGILGARLEPATFLRTYLTASLFWLSLSLGSMAVLMIHEVTGGPWGRLIQGTLRAATGTLPVMALLFAPLTLNLEAILPWAAAPSLEIIFPWAAAPSEYPQKSAYLNVPFFQFRTLSYFLIWLALTAALKAWQAELTGDRLRRTGAVGLLLYSLTVSFFAVDWIMSLEPEWFSTAIGFVVASSQVAGGLALAIVVMAIMYWNQHNPALSAGFQDTANLLLAGVMFWTYVAFMQYLIIWSGNLPEEIIWYVPRNEGAWRAIAWMLILFHFVLPFILLISRRVKQAPRILVGVASLVLLGRLVDAYWLVGPSLYPQGVFTIHWLDAATLIGIGGLWLAVFLWLLFRQSTPSPSLVSGEAGRA